MASLAPWNSEAGSLHQHVTDTANKRILTLEYLCKAHQGRTYWFNTLLFEKLDLARTSSGYWEPRRLARRATNFLLLGLSLPAVVELNSGTPLDFLRTLNALLSEFDSFQQLHGENGSASLSRARLPQMFRRAGPGSRARRAVSTPIGDVDGPSPGASAAASSTSLPTSAGTIADALASSLSSADAAAAADAVASDTDLLPGEEYVHLLTPSLPFDPDFYETFATLCDVLIDCYQRLLSLVPTPRDCPSAVAELFAKVDGRIRKSVFQAVIKEFEDASRSQIKVEMASIGRVVLAGLL